MSLRTKKDAELAAQNFLKAKSALVADIGQAWELVEKRRQAIEEAQDAFYEAEDQVRQAYQAARDGGWSREELIELGYKAPPRRRRRTSSRATDRETEE